jgi:predicted nuclease of predicted toxin-antitoxin system
MRFLVDESAGPAVARWLRDNGHEVFSVYEELRGAKDDVLILKAAEEAWILVTSDKDFGEKVYRERRPHRGVVLLRLEDQRAQNRIEALRRLLEAYSERLPGSFVVVTEMRVRFARP